MEDHYKNDLTAVLGGGDAAWIRAEEKHPYIVMLSEASLMRVIAAFAGLEEKVS